jgi:hypothetical protein
MIICLEFLVLGIGVYLEFVFLLFGYYFFPLYIPCWILNIDCFKGARLFQDNAEKEKKEYER